MTESEREGWLKAAATLSEDKSAEVLCPVCGEANLKVMGIEAGWGDKIDRRMQCPKCFAKEYLLMQKPEDFVPEEIDDSERKHQQSLQRLFQQLSDKSTLNDSDAKKRSRKTQIPSRLLFIFIAIMIALSLNGCLSNTDTDSDGLASEPVTNAETIGKPIPLDIHGRFDEPETLEETDFSLDKIQFTYKGFGIEYEVAYPQLIYDRADTNYADVNEMLKIIFLEDFEEFVDDVGFELSYEDWINKPLQYYYLSYDVAMQKQNYISVMINSELYRSPMAIIGRKVTTFNFDLENRKQLKLRDVVLIDGEFIDLVIDAIQTNYSTSHSEGIRDFLNYGVDEWERELEKEDWSISMYLVPEGVALLLHDRPFEQNIHTVVLPYEQIAHKIILQDHQLF